MSLKLRLTLFNTFFVLLTLGLGFTFLVLQTRRVFLDSIDHELMNKANRIQNNPQIRNLDHIPTPAEMNLMAQPAPPGQEANPPQGNGSDPNGANPDGGNPMGGDPQNPQANGPQGQGRPGLRGPNGQLGRGQERRGPFPGPEFAGPPNDDIARPIQLRLDGTPFDSRERQALDPEPLHNLNMRRPVLSSASVEGIPTRVITVPLIGRDKLLAFAQYGHDLHDFDRLKETQLATLFLLLPFALAVSAGVGWFLAGTAVKPIHEVAQASEKISGSDMSTRLTVKGQDEIGRLSLAFNSMVDRLQLSFEERQKLFDELKAALEQQKQFVGDASHELRTPLARLRITTSSALEQESSPAEMREALEIADQETVHMSSLVDQLLTLARLDAGRSPSLYPLSLSEVAREAAAKFPADQPNSVSLTLTPETTIQGDHDGLVRAAVNLIENARRYSPDKQISVSTQISDSEVVLTVRDYGSGIAAEHIPHLTERFYRVDDARNRKMGGTGLGLAIVKSIVEANKGRLVIQSMVGEGTAVQLIFPKISATSEAK